MGLNRWMDGTPLLVTLTHSSGRRGPSPSRECPIVPRKPPFLPRLHGCELAFRAIVAFEHALDPVARAHTHARTHLLDPFVHGHSPFNTLPVQGFPHEFRSTDPTVSFFWDTRPITSFTIKIISISDSDSIPPLLFTLLTPLYIYIYIRISFENGQWLVKETLL